MITLPAKATSRHAAHTHHANYKLLLTALVVVALCAASAFFTDTVTAQAVTWVSGVNVTITGNSVEKTGGANYTWDASAVSQEQIQDNDGADWYAEFTAPQTGASFFSVSCRTQDAYFAELEIQFAYNGAFTIYESAQNRYAGTYAANDVFRIARVSGTIKYSKNGTVIHTSVAAPSYPLIYRFDARELNSKITNASVVNDAPAPLGIAKNLAASVVTSSRIDLSWTDTATAETGFKIERRAGESGTWAQIGTTSANTTTYSDTDIALARNIPYSYRVRPTDGVNNGGYSRTGHATIPPAVLGSIKTDTAVYPEGTLPVKPLSGAYIYDPVFGTRLMRVTDMYDGSTLGGGTAYSYWPTFNLNNTRILAQVAHPNNSPAPQAAIYDFDPVNFKLGKRREPRPLPGGGYPIFQWAIWSNLSADVFYAADYSGRLWSYNVPNDVWTPVADFDTAGVNNPLPAGHYGWQMHMSADDDVFSFTESESTNWSQVGYFVYKKSTNTITKRVVDSNIDELHIDSSGRYLFGITNTHSSYDGDGAIEGFVWDLQTGAPRDNLTDSTPDMSPGHYDVGHGLIVGNANWGAGTMTKRSLATPHSFTTMMTPLAPATYGQPMDHFSMLADNPEWVFGSNYTDPNIERRCGKELFQVKLDGSQSLRRLAHHYSLYDGTDYYDSPRANISKDGKFAAFSSNWNSVNGRNDLYIAQFDAAPSSLPADDVIWVEDAVPTGSSTATDNESWSWVSSNPAPASGLSAHQSGIYGGWHQHFFYNATSTLAVSTGDKLFTYVYLDPNNLPSEVMLQWNDGTWEHRAYWGANNIPWGTDGTNSRRYMGALPPAGQWVRLEVPASQVGLEGQTLNGMAFTLYGGRATWDRAGKSSDVLWVGDAVPTGGTTSGDNEGWSWVSSNPAPASGTLAHQSNVFAGLHQHFFYNATSTLAVNTGDKLVAYVYLDPANTPSEVMLQWNVATFEHRAYWGANNIPWGVNGTDSRRYMGALPPAGQWVRLEVPASQVGLEGQTLNGMAFTLYGGRATWDHAGKSR
jgi:hypothetical protein